MKWSEVREPCEDCRYNHVVYESNLFGNLYIEWKGWKNNPSYDCVVYLGEKCICLYGTTLDQCKLEVWELLNKLVKEEILRLNS